MKSCATILQYTLLIFICNLSLILNDSDDNEDNIVMSTKIFTLANVSSSSYSQKSYSLKKGNTDVDNKVLEPSVDLKLNIDLIKDDVASYKNDLPGIVTQQSDITKGTENVSPVISLSEGSSIQLEELTQNIVSSSESEINQTKGTFLHGEVTMENISEDVQIEEPSSTEAPFHLNTPDNLTENKNEDIPSFSEWTQKRLEEVEKIEQVNASSRLQSTNGKESDAKLRWKNYASLDCGAKVIAANPEAVSPGAILAPSSDEYKLNPCNNRIWFVVELCETIQTKKIDLANYELFSSSPKDFTVSVSDRYPTRDWSIVGKFTAKDERDIQSFDIETNIFGKYIKVDIKSHYGSEHYCPISLFRAYGTSVFEVLQKEDPAHNNRVDDDDDDDDNDIINKNGDDSDNISDSVTTVTEKESDEHRKNLFSSATDAVISMVKKAAEVLGNKVNNRTIQGMVNQSRKYLPLVNTCSTPTYIINCKNCDEMFFGQIYELISCKMFDIQQLVRIPFIYQALSNSVVCQNYDYEYKLISNYSNNLLTDCVTSFFPTKYIGAMCNEISIIENRGVLNSSHEFSNTTGNISDTDLTKLKVSIPKASELELTKLGNVHESQFSETNTVNFSLEMKNFEDVSQIKPTKPFVSDFEVSQTDINLSVTSSAEINQTLEGTSKNIDTFPSTKLFEQTTEPVSDMEHISEGIDAIDDHFEHFISELNTDLTQKDSQNPSVAPSTTSTNSPQAQKESIFLRLSNRIKTLERNMSLSSQYLEELSRRYKKQVEEIQNLLEKTVITLREESFKKDVRNKQLEDRLDNLTTIIESLINERQNWFLTTCWVVFSVTFMSVIYFFCRKYSFNKSASNSEEITEVLCGKSVNPLIHSLPQKKNRRPSDQALKILHQSSANGYDENNFSQRQKKKKKKHTLKKSNSISNIKDDECYTCLDSEIKSNTDWVERSHQIIEDTPFALEESDHSALETYPLENKTMIFDSTDSASIPSFTLKTDTSSIGYINETNTEKSLYDTSNRSLSKSNVEPLKKEKRSFKKLLKKVF